MEILSEMCSGVAAKLSKYISLMQIELDDNKNPFIILYSKLAEIKNDIYLSKNASLDKLKKIEGFLFFIDEYIDELLKNE